MQLRLVVEYEGTRYHGWQLQPHGPTVQAVLEQALGTLLRAPVRVRGAGRTDAGVHACGQVVAVPVPAVPVDLGRFLRSLNALTPPDVAVREVAVTDDGFDPRRDARSRVYEYRLLLGAPSPFWRRYAWHVRRSLDVEAMAGAARVLEGEHDFATFCGADPKAPPRTTVRRVLVSEVVREPPGVVYRVEATGFLLHMVRNIVGTLVEIGRGERAEADMGVALAACRRAAAGPTAPALGLILTRVRY